jgi:hypothetical protein
MAVLAMIKTSGFSRPVASALAGLFAGIGVLTKETVVLFLVGPALIIGVRAVLRLRTAPNMRRLRVAGCMLLAAAVALAVSAPWYLTNLDTVLAFLQSSTSGQGARGMGAADPLDPAALLAFLLTIVTAASFTLVAGMVVVGAAVLANRIVRLVAPSRIRPAMTSGARRRWNWILVGSFALPPLLVFATSHNQDPRQPMLVYICFAVAFAGLVMMTRPRSARYAAVAIVLTLCVAQALVAQLPPLNPVRDAAYVNATIGSTTIPLFQPAFGVANPKGDDGTPVMRELESEANGRQADVLVAQADYIFNPNTLGWLGASRQDHFRFIDPGVLQGNTSELDNFEFAVYLPAADVDRRDSAPRLLILNQTTATTVYGDQLLKIFGRSRHQIALFDGSTVWVLQR